MRIEKKQLREKILLQRSLLTKEEIKEKSKAIFDKLMNLPQFSSSEVILCYIDFRNEVETLSFLHSCLSMGKRVAVPLVVKDQETNEMWACEISNMENLIISHYGILEPKAGKYIKLEPGDIDLVVVPGSVFDIHRQRIGYGAGYYDVFLRQTRDCCYKVAVAFDLQVVENVPVEQHDITMDKIITEGRMI